MDSKNSDNYKIKLSPYAKTCYIEWLIAPDSNRYNIVIDQILHGNIDTKRMSCALNRYVADHVLLNSHIKEIDNEPYWVKNDIINEMELVNHQLSHTDVFTTYINKSFDLYKGPLYRFVLFKISNNCYRIILVFHHLFIGGLPISLNSGVYKTLSEYYNNENYKVKYTLDEQVKLISELSNTLNKQFELNKLNYKKFWGKQLNGVDAVDLKFLKLKCRTNSDQLQNSVKEIRFCLDEIELNRLEQLKFKYNVSQYVYGRCILAALLHKYTRQEKFAISYPIAIKEGMEFIYGVQVNTIFIPYSFTPTTSIIDLFQQSIKHSTSLKENNLNYAYCPVGEIVQRDTRYLLDVIFLQANLRDTLFNFDGITHAIISSEYYVDLFNAFEFEQELRDNRVYYRIRYDKNIINEKLIANFINNYRSLFFEILLDLENGTTKAINNYLTLSQAEYKKKPQFPNNTNKYYSIDKTICQLFEEQVYKTPSNIALVYNNVTLTYLELNQKSNQIAHYLIDNYKIKPDDLINLCLSRSEHMIITIISVMKAGAAYVPIDINQPDERIGYIIKDTNAKITFTTENYEFKLNKIINDFLPSPSLMTIIPIDSAEFQSKFNTQLNSTPLTKLTNHNLIHILYTSGTTGVPKGVMLEHASCVNRILEMIRISNITANDKVLFKTNYIFDVSFSDIFTTLLTGSCLFVTANIFDLEEISNIMTYNSITICHFTPSQFDVIKSIRGSKFFNKLRIIHFSGEALNPRLIADLSKKIKIVNYYGPTETGEVSADRLTSSKAKLLEIVTIGQAINNIKLYVLDNQLNLIPTGAIGELYIGGTGLARGYLNLPELTAKKFINNPFCNEQDQERRLYKTGDLARWLPDGNIEYIGRNDSQIKIRGYRIELAEIENKLLSYPDIRQVVVTTTKLKANDFNQNSLQLIAYYVASNKLNETQILNFLTTELPEYMLPSALVYLTKLPLTPNGKLDKKSLPEVRLFNNNYAAPGSEQEHLICEAFCKVLDITRVSIDADFFRCGGNSLTAIKLAAILQTNFDIKVADIFNLRTPRLIALNVNYGQNFLADKLNRVKRLYKQEIRSNSRFKKIQQRKLYNYFQQISNCNIDTSLNKSITNVLLTGATGFLGCNILNQLLNLTNYKIYLLIRGQNENDAFNRINKTFHYYFDNYLDKYLDERLFVFNADIKQDYLGLSTQKYQNLIENIDSIIHAAALVKHYGEYDKFYSVNVQATINMLELAKLTRMKDFHFISTYGVLKYEDRLNQDIVYTEDDIPSGIECPNYYLKTKLLGEQETIKYRQFGIKSNIYRIGNLAFIAANHRIQQNINNNAFSFTLQFLFKLGYTAPQLSNVEISPVDLTALAIIKLFDKQQLVNNIYHLYNPHIFNITDAFNEDNKSVIKLLPMQQFIDNISGNLYDVNYRDIIVRFMLHQGWLESCDISNNSITILQDKSQYILKQVGFEWPTISKKTFKNYIKQIMR